MTRGPAPSVPRGYALRICLGKYTALAVALMRDAILPDFSNFSRFLCVTGEELELF